MPKTHSNATSKLIKLNLPAAKKRPLGLAIIHIKKEDKNGAERYAILVGKGKPDTVLTTLKAMKWEKEKANVPPSAFWMAKVEYSKEKKLYSLKGVSKNIPKTILQHTLKYYTRDVFHGGFVNPDLFEVAEEPLEPNSPDLNAGFPENEQGENLEEPALTEEESQALWDEDLEEPPAATEASPTESLAEELKPQPDAEEVVEPVAPPDADEVTQELSPELQEKLTGALEKAYTIAMDALTESKLSEALLEGYSEKLKDELTKALLALPDSEREKALNNMIARLTLKTRNPDDLNVSAPESEMAAIAGAIFDEIILTRVGESFLLGNIIDLADLKPEPLSQDDVAEALLLEALNKAEELDLPFDLSNPDIGNILKMVRSEWPEDGVGLAAEIEKIRTLLRNLFTKPAELRKLLGLPPTDPAMTDKQMRELRLKNRLARAMRRLKLGQTKASKKIAAVKKAGNKRFETLEVPMEKRGDWSRVDDFNTKIASQTNELCTQLDKIIQSSPIVVDDLVSASQFANTCQDILCADPLVGHFAGAAQTWSGAPGGVVEVIYAQYHNVALVLDEASGKLAAG